MTRIRILAGTWGDGAGTYASGTFHMPDGEIRGVEELADLAVLGEPETPAPLRREGIVRGLRDALAATGPLPRPLGLAASLVDFSLDAIGRDGRSLLKVQARFADGASAVIEADPGTAAAMAGDREVMRLAALRQAAASAPALPLPAPAPAPALPTGGAFPSDETLASIFSYEKRKGRLRRLPEKTPDEA